MNLRTKLAGGVLAATAAVSSGTALTAAAAQAEPAQPGPVQAAPVQAAPAAATRVQAPDQTITVAGFNCEGKSPQRILARYGHVSTKYGYPVALRCGNSSWGYKHFYKRWSNNFESHLERTLNYPTAVKQGGNKVIVCRKVSRSGAKKWFKVVHTTFYSKKEIGIITAVWESKTGTCEKW
ncbi:hypothetical protein AGRA3207_002438 [Actinomadura graeca]|uniref:Secreted protein n=1 Tax=Actinomadura graeca TaxID=2750812 RepID=A0ABX8QTQ6_9ACTN|nr:hypothetical protein [Actinomadura graeca]QXJ21574.1 hypothetical protein AGRA3207_002438 [Actinomadura graeca]